MDVDYALGIMFALSAAVVISAVDAARKLASRKLSPATLVALPAAIEACAALVAIWTLGGFNTNQQATQGIFQPALVCLALISAALLLYSRLLYQGALAVAPLSLTVNASHGCMHVH